MKRLVLRLGYVVLAVLGLAAPGWAQDEMRSVDVRFAPGTSGTSIDDEIVGRETVLYNLGLQAGQELNIRLSSPSTSIYFNVYEPGTGPGDQALAVSEITGPTVPEINAFSGPLARSGSYTIMVYLYRNAARDGDTASYTLDVWTGAAGDFLVEAPADAGDVPRSSEPLPQTQSFAGTPTPAQQACLDAVAETTRNPEVIVLDSQFSQAGTLVSIGVGPDKGPWQCIAYEDGATDAVMFMGDEGRL